MTTNLFLRDPDLFRQQAYIGGRWCDADSGATLKVNNPATGEILGTVPLMVANETRRAIEAAKDAFIDWSRKPAKERSLIDQAAVEKVEEHIQDAVSKGGRVLLGGKRHAHVWKSIMRAIH